MSWHYQIRKRVDGRNEVWFDIVEVYDKPLGWTTEGCEPGGETAEEVIRELENMLKDAKHYPVLEDTENAQHTKK